MSFIPATPMLVARSTYTNATDINALSPYHYIPTESICIIYVVLFSISSLCHVFQMFKYRLWWLLPTVILAGAGEVLGWSGRLWSSQNVMAQHPFMIQIVCLLVAPTPFVAAVFMSFGHLVIRLGERYSRLTARKYSRVFLSCDIASLLIQVAGGSIAAGASTDSGAKLGSNIMLIGIITQMISLLLFMVLAAMFFISFLKDHPVREMNASSGGSTVTLVGSSTRGRPWNRQLKQFSGALALITTVLMIRAVYRTIELADGWNGPVISTQRWFNIFDGIMVTIAMYTLNIFHPGRLLFSQPPPEEGMMLMSEKNALNSTTNLV